MLHDSPFLCLPSHPASASFSVQHTSEQSCHAGSIVTHLHTHCSCVQHSIRPTIHKYAHVHSIAKTHSVRMSRRERPSLHSGFSQALPNTLQATPQAKENLLIAHRKEQKRKNACAAHTHTPIPAVPRHCLVCGQPENSPQSSAEECHFSYF